MAVNAIWANKSYGLHTPVKPIASFNLSRNQIQQEMTSYRLSKFTNKTGETIQTMIHSKNSDLKLAGSIVHECDNLGSETILQPELRPRKKRKSPKKSIQLQKVPILKLQKLEQPDERQEDF